MCARSSACSSYAILILQFVTIVDSDSILQSHFELNLPKIYHDARLDFSSPTIDDLGRLRRPRNRHGVECHPNS